MKNATKHAENLKNLHKKLLKEGKPEPKQTIDPLRAIVMGTLSADTPDSRVQAAMAVIDSEFVSINELRVATELEVISLIGEKYPDIEHRALVLREMLNYLFEKEHTLTLDRIKTLGRKESRTALRELPEITSYIEAYTALFGFDEPAVPVDQGMLEILQSADAVEKETTPEEAQKFVESQIKGDDCYEFFAVLRRAGLKRGK
jgi:endonuclease III